MTREYPAFPMIGVGVVVWRGDRVLLIQRGKAPRLGEWSLPGGRQELGETVAEAARREVREETGLIIDIHDVVAVIDSIHRDDRGQIQYHYTLIDLLAEWRDGTATAGDDAAAIAWATLAELPQFGVWRETEAVIRRSAQMREQRHAQ